MKNKLVFLDIDGTMIDSGERIYDSTIEAITKARENGHKLFICTGRQKNIVTKKLFEIGFNDGVFSAGANVVCDNKLIYHNSFSAEKYNKAIDVLLRHKPMVVLECLGEEIILEETYKEKFAYFRKWLDGLGAIGRNSSPRDFDKADKIVYFDPDCSIEQLQAELDNEMVIVPMSYQEDREGGEIMQGGITKASGIQKVLDYYNMDISDTIGIGDGSNDVEMLEYCNLGIAMGNGADSAKNAADYITDDIKKDGLYKAFKYAGLI